MPGGELNRLRELAVLLRASGEGAPGVEEKLAAMRALRQGSASLAQDLDRLLLEETERLRAGLQGARESQERLAALLEKLTAPPWFPAVVLEAMAGDEGETALVSQGSERRLVALADGLRAEELRRGDEVLLAHERNVALRRAPALSPRSGETARFERLTPDGRLVLGVRDEELVVDAAGELETADLRPGDLLRWDRSAWMACERLARSEGDQLFLEETPIETFAAIGGLDAQIRSVCDSVSLHLRHPAVVERYRLPRKRSILLCGPPGTGKTMLARALANWLAGLGRARRARFMNLKPAALHSSWYAQSEANYREAFRVAREAGAAEPEVPVVMFFDEVDALGAARGSSHMRVDDRVLTAFMTELDGLEARGNVLVVAATNRRQALDPALLRPGRLGDLVLDVPRPDRAAAREILGKYLPAEIPYGASEGGEEAGECRTRLLDAAVSRIFAPNADTELARLTFRDGRERAVEARDLVSGALLAQVARGAIESACLREIEGGPPGVTLDDLLGALATELEAAAAALGPANCANHLSGLPQDVDVVRVEPVVRRVRRPQRFLSVA